MMTKNNYDKFNAVYLHILNECNQMKSKRRLIKESILKRKSKRRLIKEDGDQYYNLTFLYCNPSQDAAGAVGFQYTKDQINKFISFCEKWHINITDPSNKYGGFTCNTALTEDEINQCFKSADPNYDSETFGSQVAFWNSECTSANEEAQAKQALTKDPINQLKENPEKFPSIDLYEISPEQAEKIRSKRTNVAEYLYEVEYKDI